MKNNKKISLFIHIGTHKTGSTAIQHFLHHNREILLKKGVGYFTSTDSRNAHHDLAFALREKNYSFIHDYLESIEQFAKDNNVTNIVLSSEEFETIRNSEKLFHLKRFDLVILCYLRRQDFYLESEYNQLVRLPARRYSDSIYKFAFEQNYDRRFNYKNLYETWLKLVPSSSIKFMPFFESNQTLDLFKVLLNKINVEWDDEFTLPTTAEANISLSPKAIIYLARFNRKKTNFAIHQRLIKILSEIFPKVQDQRLFCSKDVAALLSRFEKTNEFVEDIFSFKFDKNVTVQTYIDFEQDFNKSLALEICNRVVDKKISNNSSL